MGKTIFGHEEGERRGAPGGPQYSGVNAERTPMLWRRVLRDLQDHGKDSGAIAYLDLDTSHHPEDVSRLKGARLREACKHAFYGRVSLPLDALYNLGTLPPRRPAPPILLPDDAPEWVKERVAQGKSVEGIGPDGTDLAAHDLDEDELKVVRQAMERRRR